MHKSKGQIGGMQLVVLGVIAVVGAGLLGVADVPGIQPLSGVSGDQAPSDSLSERCEQIGAPAERCGESATVSVKTTDLANEDSSTSVVTDMKLYNGDDGFVTSTGYDGTNRVSFTDLTVGESYTVHGYNGTAACNAETGDIDAATVREDLNCWTTISSGNVGTTFFDEDDSSSTSITISSGETYTAEGLRVRASQDNTAYNPYVVAFNDSQLTNLDNDPFSVTGAEEIDVPDSLSSDYTQAFVVYDAGAISEGDEPLLQEFESRTSGAITIAASGDPSGELGIGVLDRYPFQADDDSTQDGVEDDSDSDVGTGLVTLSIDVS